MPNLYAVLLIVLVIAAGLLYWLGGSESRKEVRGLKAIADQVAESNETTRKTQSRVDAEGHSTRKRAQADDQELRKGADTGAAPADDGGMLVAQAAHAAALCAARRVLGKGASDGAACPREHD